jgi:hypothetical protein
MKHILIFLKDSWINELDEYPNLIITQTLSKAYGLAGTDWSLLRFYRSNGFK